MSRLDTAGSQQRVAPGEGIGQQVTGLHIHHNIAPLEKGASSEGGVPLRVSRNPASKGDQR